MTKFERFDENTAPEAALPLIEKSKKAFGRLPGLHAVMAGSPALLDGYQVLHRLFAEETAFDADEKTVVWQTINVYHECHYCVPAHTGIAKAMGVSDDISNALRDETPLPNAKLEALRDFVLIMLDTRGNPTDAQMQAFFDAGYEQRHVLDIILGMAQKVMSNFTNHVAQTPVDAPMQKFDWTPKSKR
ncbi:carboxymuconolactone decarboxylase family protein [Paracoccus sp. 1_MG-2023]|uniref:carboxymuconolactone decarboxylase family protein n=1 Tax=unclassified Paracoccus (in: a-proteobacteria) TaxID=2688777 RepID=UPI001C0A391E|nr:MULTISPECIES: carboxymuconolactone decarboxylase family protein [unclassified Paracoccus (in: a-proteobacteria)]MBU2956136.1 carboxymuconolactone decarboxylase family protein [Paracoccus sp. C2R09]MDO6667812.1 carboxymuconolactone decarboxylase family protein [Paracoccus sp. 1_MG-2023]